MVFRLVNFVPGLYKIFDEILVNAADNKVRDASMDTMRVDIDAVSWARGAVSLRMAEVIALVVLEAAAGC
jgi:hypothetical protein